MNWTLALLFLAIATAQQPDPFEALRIAAEEKEKEFQLADEEFRNVWSAGDLCAAATLQLTQNAKTKSDLALVALMDYYREWKNRNEGILRYQQSSEKEAAMEFERIKSEVGRADTALASLKRRVADLAALPVDKGRDSHLRELMAEVEDNLRSWQQVLREFQAESPQRRKTIARAESLVHSIAGTIRAVEGQQRWYAQRYAGRLSSIKFYCHNKP